MRALDKKLLRDLVRLRFQALSIALLVACGVASFVSAIAAAASMEASRDAFYRDARLADVFDSVARAPRSVLPALRELPGVAAVEARVVGTYRVALDASDEPVTARFVSVDASEPAGLDRVVLLAGRAIEPGRSDEILVSAALAEAWGLVPGDALTATIEGRRARLRIVGVAISPDTAFVASTSGFSDPRHFGIVWMDDKALGEAIGMRGAFDEVAFALSSTADVAETLARIDRALAPWGGTGAYPRSDQYSAKLVDQKVGQLVRLSRTLPTIFLGIAAFLLHVLLSRVVGTQREQIATMKALGYRTGELMVHYVELALAICAVGVVAGLGLGTAGAHALLAMYARFFKFPAYLFRLDAGALAVATAIVLAAGVGGAALSVRRAVAIPPAEAMRPEAPPSYKKTALDGLYRSFPPVARMILRDVMRRPVRLALSAASISLATSIVLSGSVFGDSMDELLHLEFEVSHRETIAVTLAEAKPVAAVREIAHMPHVVTAEGQRVVPIRLKSGPLVKTTAVMGVEAEADLRQLLGADRRRLAMPPSGLALSRTLGEELGARPGDVVELEVLESDRRTLRVPVAALVDDLLGLAAYMSPRELADLLGEDPRVNEVLLAADIHDVDELTARLDELPSVASVSRPAIDRDLVRAQIGDVFSVLSAMLAVFASVIAVGVVYNNARISLEVKARDLATMRILGFTRGELAWMLIGEQAIQVVLGVAPGLVLGRVLGGLSISTIDHELVRIPLAVAPRSYAAAAAVVLLAALASAVAVRRRSDRLDLVAVLKARD